MKALLLVLSLLFTASPLTGAECNVSLKQDFGMLCGTLRTPEAGSDAVALLITGSGPMDRNNNAPNMGINTNTFLYLTQALEEQGIASLRYDKRGVGASRYDAPEQMSQVVFDDFVADAARWVIYLKEQGFKKIVLVGHSEGSLVALCVAADENSDAAGKVSGVVSISGAGFPIDEILQMQLAAQLAMTDMSMLMHATTVLDSLRQGKTAKDYPPELAMLFEPYLQRYLISQMNYKPQQLIRRVTVPVLILNGDNDIQVSVANAEALKKAKPNAELLIIKGMTHVLKQSEGRDQMGQLGVYTNADLPLDATLAEAIPRFILRL